MIRQFLSRNSSLFLWLRTMRMALQRYRRGLKSIDPTAYIAPSADVQTDLVMEPYSFINVECLIGPGVSIGAYSMLGPRVAVVGGDHKFDRPEIPIIFSGRGETNPTKIGKDAWVGYGAVIMAGCTIGDGAIIAAGAIVTKDVPAFKIYAGVPAKCIGERFPDEQDRLIHEKMLQTPPRMHGEYCEPR